MEGSLADAYRATIHAPMFRKPSADCPACATAIPSRQLIQLEFFGGDIVCGCGAVLHLDHHRWWMAVMLLGVELWLLVLVVVVLLASRIGWWIVALAVAAFVALGVLVALTSPPKIVVDGR